MWICRLYLNLVILFLFEQVVTRCIFLLDGKMRLLIHGCARAFFAACKSMGRWEWRAVRGAYTATRNRLGRELGQKSLERVSWGWASFMKYGVWWYRMPLMCRCQAGGGSLVFITIEESSRLTRRPPSLVGYGMQERKAHRTHACARCLWRISLSLFDTAAA